jgi:hypothetical protein
MATSLMSCPRIRAEPAVGKNQAHQELERGRLTSAVRAEKPKDLAGLYV